MPDHPQDKPRPHPGKHTPVLQARGPRPGVVRYAELAVTSNFSFLKGASHPDELVAKAAELGHIAAAIADTNTLAGVVRAHSAAKDLGIPLAVGCRLVLAKPAGLSVLVYPTGRAAYGRLCRLLTLGKRRSEKGECSLSLEDLLDYQEGMLAVALPPERLDEPFAASLKRLRGVFTHDRLSLGAGASYGPDDRGRLTDLSRLGASLEIALAAVNDVLYHEPRRRPLQDVLTCIREGCTIEEAGLRLAPNSERHLKEPAEMARLFAPIPGALSRSAEIALAASAFSLDQLRYEYPEEIVPHGCTPMGHLAELTRQGALWRYPDGAPDQVRMQIDHELRLIEELGYAPYFLTVHDLVTFARSRGILCQGRGAAANSAICYCLGVTSVDPGRIDLLFERFVSKERGEPPDIDIDFEHERREEVIQYLYAKYGRDRAALTAEVISYRGKSAVRDVGKAMGLSLDCVDRLAKSLDWWDSGNVPEDRIRELGLDPSERTLRMTLTLTRELLGFPRHLSQHVGGFVISRGPLCESVPIENAAMPDRTVIEWDKDDLDALGMLKVDVLGLGMLTAIRKGFELIKIHHGLDLSLASVPPEDQAVYDMLCQADSVGVFQVESRAQMSMLPRLKPRSYYDLVIEVAIVRPGPIQGNMVHPYLRRRGGEERFTFPSPEVERVLGKTLGVPLFQEQAMQLAIVAAGFTPGEADQLRRAMAAWKRKGDLIERFGQKLVSGMTEKGYPEEFARRCFEQIKGFSEYGFPESHAASFALLVYVSAWIKKHHPAAFAAALINSQPMGFYTPGQLVRDAQAHGVEVRGVDVNASGWDCGLEDGGRALRLGTRLVSGLGEAEAGKIRGAVEAHGAFRSVLALWRSSGAKVRSLRRLAAADAFTSMGLARQAALWQVRGLRDEELPLFDGREEHGPEVRLPALGPGARIAQDYSAIGLSLKGHPMGLVRQALAGQGVITAAQLSDPDLCPMGRRVQVAGLVVLRQRPATAGGTVFMTLEDETGSANLILRERVFARDRRAARHSGAVVAQGRVERRGRVVHVLVSRVLPLTLSETEVEVPSRDFR